MGITLQLYSLKYFLSNKYLFPEDKREQLISSIFLSK